MQAQANKLDFLGSCFGHVFPEKKIAETKNLQNTGAKITIFLDKQNMI